MQASVLFCTIYLIKRVLRWQLLKVNKGANVTITIYMGDKKLQKDEHKKYVCTSEYVINLVNEVYYEKIAQFNKLNKTKIERVDNIIA